MKAKADPLFGPVRCVQCAACPVLDKPRCQRTDSGIMNLEDIGQIFGAAFRPFNIRTSHGREFPVPLKEFIFRTSRSVIVSTEEGCVDMLDPLHIAFHGSLL